MKIDTDNDLILRPESALEVSNYAKRALRAADATGKLPTPIDDLLAAAKVGNLKIDHDVKESFYARLNGSAKQAFETMWQQVRGIADLRRRVTYVDENTSQTRVRFAKGHELGHQILPWHKLNPGRFDDDKSLNCDAEEIFDAEANFFSAEVTFQGDRFSQIVRDYAFGFDTIFHVAQLHDASRHATAWRCIDEHDEAVALVPYWPCKFKLGDFYRGKIVASSTFLRRFSVIDVPRRLAQDHPWMAAQDSSLIHNDMISLDCDGGKFSFEWEAWWNGYALLVMLRRKPVFHFVRDIAQKVSLSSG